MGWQARLQLSTQPVLLVHLAGLGQLATLLAGALASIAFVRQGRLRQRVGIECSLDAVASKNG